MMVISKNMNRYFYPTNFFYKYFTDDMATNRCKLAYHYNTLKGRVHRAIRYDNLPRESNELLYATVLQY